MTKPWILLAAFAMLSAETALAQETVSPEASPVTRPIWEVRPPIGQYPPSPFPIAEYRLNVSLTCRVNAGMLVACVPGEGASESFAAQAIEAAAQARVAALDGHGQPTDGRLIRVMIGFPIPVAVDPPPPPPAQAYITDPVWLERPATGEVVRFAAEGPAALTRMEVLLDCLVASSGQLSCTAISETPPGRGFAEQARRHANGFRMAPQTESGEPTSGRRMRMTIRFEPEP